MPTKAFQVGRNLTVAVDGAKMIITIDISEKGQLSGTGKSMTIATTGAAQAVGQTPDGRPIKLNLSAYAAVPA